MTTSRDCGALRGGSDNLRGELAAKSQQAVTRTWARFAQLRGCVYALEKSRLVPVAQKVRRK